MNVPEIRARKQSRDKLSMVTCYDFWTARVLNASSIDLILVGDSAAMVVHGFETTLAATVEMMTTHIAAVARGAPDKFIVGDMPFPTFHRGPSAAMECVDQFVKAGAQAVKLEGIDGHEDVVSTIVQSGVPVMGHVGLVPQAVNAMGGYRVQGRTPEAAQKVVADAQRLEEAGCFSLVVEGLPAGVGKQVTAAVGIPTIGIGAGRDVDGQVLVLQDLAGFNTAGKPKFVREYIAGASLLRNAVDEFDKDTKAGAFPDEGESYR